MKKLLIGTISAVFVLGSLGACASSGDVPPHTEHSGEWVYNEFSHYYQNTCGCPSPDIAELHVSNDGDDKCDICGYGPIEVAAARDDKIIYAWYDYKNEYNSPASVGIDTDALDIDMLVDLANSLEFTDLQPEFFKTKIRCCIRHYNGAEGNSFFESGTEQYEGLNGSFTSEYADVLYTVDFVYGQIMQKYTDQSGEVTKYAVLTADQLAELKSCFAPLAEAVEPKEGTFSLSVFEIWLDEIKAEDIVSVRIIEDTAYNNDFRYIYTSSSESVKRHLLTRFGGMEMFTVDQDQAAFSKEDKSVVQFILSDGRVKSVTYYGARYYVDGERIFKFISPTESAEGMDLSYSFTAEEGATADVIAGAEGLPLCEIPLSELEFVKCAGDNVQELTAVKYTAISPLGNLLFYTDEIFLIEGDTVYYQLKDSDLGDLIAKYCSVEQGE